MIRVTWRNLAAAVLVSAGVAGAQQSMDYASISGRVTDSSGAVVPGAQVTATHRETNVSATTVTDRSGRFRFPHLQVGRCEVTVRQPGFRDATQVLTLTVGAAFSVPAHPSRPTGFSNPVASDSVQWPDD